MVDQFLALIKLLMMKFEMLEHVKPGKDEQGSIKSTRLQKLF